MTWISYAQNFEDVILRRALGHVKEGFYIDVGAQHPLIDSVSRSFYELGWRGIHVEPVPYYAKLLQEDRPDERVFACALANEEGEGDFFQIDETGLSTSIETLAQVHAQHNFSVKKTKVSQKNLKFIFDRAGKQEIHWLKIDVEGAEEAVLRGWKRHTARPWDVVVESTKPLSEEASFAMWEPLLRARGYRMVYFDGLNRFYLHKTHLDLLPAFSHGPCVFDDFSLSGLACAPFCQYVLSLNVKRSL
jgi:FkbM family methyltransferase